MHVRRREGSLQSRDEGGKAKNRVREASGGSSQEGSTGRELDASRQSNAEVLAWRIARVRAELATRPPNHTGASSPRARAKSRPGGVNEEEPCYSQSAVRLRVRHLVAVALSYPLRCGPRDFPLVCHVCLCA